MHSGIYQPTRGAGGFQDYRITLTAARYACEEAATLVRYAILLVEYTEMCHPLHVAQQRVARLTREIEEAEKREQERQEEVSFPGKIR